jgi:hypothetical protein
MTCVAQGAQVLEQGFLMPLARYLTGPQGGKLHYTGLRGPTSRLEAAKPLTVLMLALPFTKSATLWDAFRPVVESRVSAEQ